jgi:hypothetical protein
MSIGIFDYDHSFDSSLVLSLEIKNIPIGNGKGRSP